MDKAKQQRLQLAGFEVTSVEEWLDLTPQQVALIDLKIDLSEAVKAKLQEKGITQQQLAVMLQSSQPRINHMLNCKPSISVDFYLRALFALGANREQLGATVAGRSPEARKRTKPKTLTARAA